MQVNATRRRKHLSAGSMQCLERIAGIRMAVYFTFAGESLGWDSLLRICPKSTGQMGLHWILSRLSYNVLLQSSNTFSALPTSFLYQLPIADVFLVDPKQVQLAKCDHHARRPQP